MGRLSLWEKLGVLVVAAITAFSMSGVPAAAVSTNSDNYQVTEMQFGSGGTLESCSEGYCARASIGDMSAGDGAVSPSTAVFGPAVSTEPLLEVIVDQGASNLGELTTEKTATKTMVVRVKTYLSDGYIVQVVGDAPKYKEHSLYTPSRPAVSTPGKEQFGLNVVANSSPQTGADPIDIPSGVVNLSLVESNYRTPNSFMYTSGDIVARNRAASGQTDYTISMIINISSATPAGHYTGDYAAVVTPIF